MLRHAGAAHCGDGCCGWKNALNLNDFFLSFLPAGVFRFNGRQAGCRRKKENQSIDESSNNIESPNINNSLVQLLDNQSHFCIHFIGAENKRELKMERGVIVVRLESENGVEVKRIILQSIK